MGSLYCPSSFFVPPRYIFYCAYSSLNHDDDDMNSLIVFFQITFPSPSTMHIHYYQPHTSLFFLLKNRTMSGKKRKVKKYCSEVSAVQSRVSRKRRKKMCSQSSVGLSPPHIPLSCGRLQICSSFPPLDYK